MDKVIGIDLGTTNSCVAIVENGNPVVIANRGGYKTTPSMVAITEAGKKLVGHIAKRQAITNAENTVYGAKRLIGRKWNATQTKSALATCSYRLEEGPHGDVRIALRDKLLSVPEISAIVLQEMKIIAEDYLGEPVSKAVITVPAYFNDNQRQATKDAGQIAGLEVIRIINEPTAAALSYGVGKSLEKTVAVYDFGGGTFDISVLELGGNGVFNVVATAGDTFLGGEDIDRLIIDWLIEGFEQEHAMDLRQDRMALQRLKDAAEKAKCELSSVRETEVNLPFIISSGRNEALHLQRTLTRDILEHLASTAVERSIEICRQTLEDAQLRTSDVDEVVLVGGMTRMPLVQAAVQSFFGREPNRGVHPDEVVALGAAIQGHALVRDGSDRSTVSVQQPPRPIMLLDVTPHPLGILTVGGVFEEIIAHNTKIPASRSKRFTTSRDLQTQVRIAVVQKDAASNLPDALDTLGEFVFSGLRAARMGEVELDVTFSLDANGIASVTATNLETGVEQSVQITSSSGLTRDEVSDMAQAAKHELTERRAAEAFEGAKQEAERLIAEIEKLFPQVQQIVASSDFGRDAVEKARSTVDKTRVAIAAGDASAVTEQLEALTRTHRMFKGVVAKT